MCAALGIIGGSTRIKTMVVITKRSELVETRHAVGERWNVEEPNAGDLTLAIDIEQQVAAYPHRACLTSLSKLEVDDSLAAVRFRDERRVDFHGGDVGLRSSRRQNDACILDLHWRRERRQLAHVRPDRDFDAIDATFGDVEDDPRAILSLDLHGAAHPVAIPAGLQLRRQNVGVSVPLVLHLGRRAIRWLELHGDVHVWLSLSVANLDVLSGERVVQNERTVSFFQTLTRRFVSSRAANAIFKVRRGGAKIQPTVSPASCSLAHRARSRP